MTDPYRIQFSHAIRGCLPKKEQVKVEDSDDVKLWRMFWRFSGLVVLAIVGATLHYNYMQAKIPAAAQIDAAYAAGFRDAKRDMLFGASR